jgi:hypothetical protein
MQVMISGDVLRLIEDLEKVKDLTKELERKNVQMAAEIEAQKAQNVRIEAEIEAQKQKMTALSPMLGTSDRRRR